MIFAISSHLQSEVYVHIPSCWDGMDPSHLLLDLSPSDSAYYLRFTFRGSRVITLLFDVWKWAKSWSFFWLAFVVSSCYGIALSKTTNPRFQWSDCGRLALFSQICSVVSRALGSLKFFIVLRSILFCRISSFDVPWRFTSLSLTLRTLFFFTVGILLGCWTIQTDFLQAQIHDGWAFGVS